MKNQIIVFTNGMEETWPALEYAVWLASAARIPLKVKGVVESPKRAAAVEAMLARVEALAPADVKTETGVMDEVIIQAGEQETDALLVFGPYRRSSFRQWLLGDSFRRVMASVAAPILHVPKAMLPPKRILVCVGGLGYALSAEALGIDIAGFSHAELTLFHVIPPITLDYPTTRQVHAHMDDLIESDTPPGRALRSARHLAQEAGLNPVVQVRQGYVLDEIRSEIRTGHYDLVCMGSMYSAHGLRHLTAPNVTAEVAHSAKCPVLSARYLANPQNSTD